MTTREGICYPTQVECIHTESDKSSESMTMKNTTTKISLSCMKGTRDEHNRDSLDDLPDDLVIDIMIKVISSASCPSDFINVLGTCKRIRWIALQSSVLAKASHNTFLIKARNWSESAHRFFKLCAESGNPEACYTLGMIYFYCLHKRRRGAYFMAKAAVACHAQALYSLAIIKFNGSGGTKMDMDLNAGVILCARAASLGHIDALRELGYCLQDGYGVSKKVTEGQWLVLKANLKELSMRSRMQYMPVRMSLFSDCASNVEVVNVMSEFLVGWYKIGKGRYNLWLRMCSNDECGRRETRMFEFRKCSICGNVNYCSRACQARHWKVRHKEECNRNFEMEFVGGG